MSGAARSAARGQHGAHAREQDLALVVETPIDVALELAQAFEQPAVGAAQGAADVVVGGERAQLRDRVADPPVVILVRGEQRLVEQGTGAGGVERDRRETASARRARAATRARRAAL